MLYFIYFSFLLVLAAFFVLAYFRPKIALVLIFTLLPCYLVRFTVFAVPATLLESLILLLAAVCLLKSIIQSKFKTTWQVFFKNYRLPLLFSLFFLGAAALALTYSVRASEALGAYRAYFLEPVILLGLFLFLMKEEKDFKRLFWGLGLSVFLASLAGVGGYFFEIGIPAGYLYPVKRAVAIFPYPAALALYLAPFLTLQTVLLARKKWLGSRLFYFLLLSTVTGFVALFLTRAEGGIGAYFLALVFWGIFSKHRLKVLGLALLGVILVFTIPPVRSYALQIATFKDVSGEVRLALWQGTWNLLKARPFTGAGLASFPAVYEQYKLARHTELLLYPHNFFLNFWVETGLPGLISVMLLLGMFIKNVWDVLCRQNRRSRTGVFQYAPTQTSIVLAAFLAMFCLLIYGLVDVPYFKNDLACQFFLFFGLVFAKVGKEKNKNQKNISLFFKFKKRVEKLS